MALVTDGDLAVLCDQHGGDLELLAEEPDPEGMAWWAASGAADFVEDDWADSEEAVRLNDLALARYDDRAENLWPAFTDRAGAAGADGRFVAAMRKGGPAVTLAYGLGPEAFGLLPGRFGDFVLGVEEAAAALPAVESALDIGGERREQALRRMGAWIAGMTDAGDQDPAELLDGPLRLFRRAAAESLGLISLSMWF